MPNVQIKSASRLASRRVERTFIPFCLISHYRTHGTRNHRLSQVADYVAPPFALKQSCVRFQGRPRNTRLDDWNHNAHLSAFLTFIVSPNRVSFQVKSKTKFVCRFFLSTDAAAASAKCSSRLSRNVYIWLREARNFWHTPATYARGPVKTYESPNRKSFSNYKSPIYNPVVGKRAISASSK